MGWDEYGLPREDTLRELGIGELAELAKRVKQRLQPHRTRSDGAFA